MVREPKLSTFLEHMFYRQGDYRAVAFGARTELRCTSGERTMNARTTVTRTTGMDVGCKRDAEACVDGMLREIGHGAQRRVYADARMRFVYKLETEWYPGANRDEYDAFVNVLPNKHPELRQYGSPVALYHVTQSDGSIVDVLAMPFRKDHSNDAPLAESRRFESRLRNERGVRKLQDMHGANYRVTANGRIKITDLGFGG